MKIVAVIPARGGSKRIPRKNIKPFLGKPIIAYSIEAALSSQLFDEVMVSTDDDEIAGIAEDFGAQVPFMRSAENADDYAGTPEVLAEVIKSYQSLDRRFEIGCCIYPTAPFVTSEKLQASLQLLEDKKFDTVFPVMQFSSPIQRAIRLTEGNKMGVLYPEHINKRSQDLEPSYHDAGQYYWFRPDKLVASLELWTDNSGVVIYPPMEVQDIDNPEDWELAELKYSMLQKP